MKAVLLLLWCAQYAVEVRRHFHLGHHHFLSDPQIRLISYFETAIAR